MNHRNPHIGAVSRSLLPLTSFRAFLEDEFLNRVPDWNGPSSRRRFLRLMGASIALAGASACTRQPKEVIVPYVRQPEELIPGKPLFYATAMSVAGIATGVLVESHMGRPTKIEGNPEHPGSLGATDAAMQASILTLYDPDRSQVVTRDGYIWVGVASSQELTGARDAAVAKKGLRLPDSYGNRDIAHPSGTDSGFPDDFPAANGINMNRADATRHEQAHWPHSAGRSTPFTGSTARM